MCSASQPCQKSKAKIDKKWLILITMPQNIRKHSAKVFVHYSEEATQELVLKQPISNCSNHRQKNNISSQSKTRKSIQKNSKHDNSNIVAWIPNKENSKPVIYKKIHHEQSKISDAELSKKRKEKVIQYKYHHNRPILMLEQRRGSTYKYEAQCSRCGNIESYCYLYKRHNWGDGIVVLCSRCKNKVMNNSYGAISYSKKLTLQAGKFDGNCRRH